jgi:glycolate oxidase FAD binding subunit
VEATHGLHMMSTQPAWLPSLETLVSAEQLDIQATHLQEHGVDGLVPRAIVYPESTEQVAAILHWAQQEKLALLPRGSGTKTRLGSIPRRLEIVLSTSRLSKIHEYDVANFTLTAGAGVRFSSVAELTAAQMQTLPLQYSFSAATLGGLIATNAASPKRLLYGGVRDLLLGIRVALPSGEIAHFGGKVVKNVAGYDMCKLFLGSQGSLGVILEATCKLYASPERDETQLAAFPSLGQGAAAVAQIMGTQLLPSQMLLLNLAASTEVAPEVVANMAAGGGLLVLNWEGMDEAVERQLLDSTRICQGQGAAAVHRCAGEAQGELRQRLTIFNPCGHAQTAHEPHLLVRLGTVPARVPAVMDALARLLGPQAPHALIAGDCGVGLIHLGLQWNAAEAAMIDDSLLRTLRELRRLVAPEGGYAVVESAPLQIKERLDVWGPLPTSFPLLQTLKRTFDPEGILSPGRFIGGL